MMDVKELLAKTLKNINSSPLPSIHQFLDPMLEIFEVESIIDVDFSKVINFSNKDEYDKHVEEKDGFLIEKNSGNILLYYQHDFKAYRETNERYGRKGAEPKYHLTKSCDKITDLYKYRYTTDTTGLFEGEDGNQTVSLPIKLCKNCFKNIYGRYPSSDSEIDNFNLVDVCEQLKQKLA